MLLKIFNLFREFYVFVDYKISCNIDVSIYRCFKEIFCGGRMENLICEENVNIFCY